MTNYGNYLIRPKITNPNAPISAPLEIVAIIIALNSGVGISTNETA
ncbi:MAG: hypothetical protein NXH75_07080 [Halobacteriovoraceae bacterium]|nr:hypothetical protein [Halobacteriovoraceae bacterium]